MGNMHIGNASSSIEVCDDVMNIFFREEHSPKANTSIEVTNGGITICVIDMHP